MNDALTRILAVLKEPGLRYFAVGSVASSIHGLPRFTQDVDLVVRLDLSHIGQIAALTSREFYMDTEEAGRALKQERAFNLIHLATASKIDIFPMRETDFHMSELSRSAQQDWIIPGEDSVRMPVASAEDTVLSKLVWYRQGGQVSDRPWNDLPGVASTRAHLDWDYIRGWGPRSGVADLVERLFAGANHFE